MQMEMISSWDNWVEEALAKLESKNMLLPLTPIYLPNDQQQVFQVFEKMQQWDRSSVEVEIAEETFQRWVNGIPSSGDEIVCRDRVTDNEEKASPQEFKKLLLLSGSDYLGLNSHPTIKNAAVKAVQEHGMGPTGSPLACGYTNYHRLLEFCLADLEKKEECLVCPTGYAANMATMVALANVGSVLSAGRKPLEEEKVAIFSDELNHASIIDGIHLAERRQSVKLFVYRHSDMSHLDALLSNCRMKKKVVVTDGLFSMEGEFAQMVELVKLRKKHQFLLVVDDAHGAFTYGKNGGGVAGMFNCERDVDIYIATLSKALSCQGGFIACSKRWKLLIQSTGRTFIFSTALPVPIAAAAHAAVIVAKKETWRRRAIQNLMRDFHALTGVPITSAIISLIVGTEENAQKASRHLLRFGFHVIAIRPPVVPPNSCRLRVTLSAAHTKDDLKKLVTALSQCINFQDYPISGSNGHARL